MALEINNIDGVICLKGNVSNSQIQELKGYLKALFTIQDRILLNMCQIHKGIETLSRELDAFKKETPTNKILDFYGFASPQVKQLYANINHPSNFYQAA